MEESTTGVSRVRVGDLGVGDGGKGTGDWLEKGGDFRESS